MYLSFLLYFFSDSELLYYINFLARKLVFLNEFRAKVLSVLLKKKTSEIFFFVINFPYVSKTHDICKFLRSFFLHNHKLIDKKNLLSFCKIYFYLDFQGRIKLASFWDSSRNITGEIEKNKAHE